MWEDAEVQMSLFATLERLTCAPGRTCYSGLLKDWAYANKAGRSVLDNWHSFIMACLLRNHYELSLQEILESRRQGATKENET